MEDWNLRNASFFHKPLDHVKGLLRMFADSGESLKFSKQLKDALGG